MRMKIVRFLALFLFFFGCMFPFQVYAADSTPKVSYEICEINVGWSGSYEDNQTLKLNDGHYMTAFRAHLYELAQGQALGIRYEVNLSGFGWLHGETDGRKTGFAGGTRPIEAIRAELYRADAENYDLYYRVYQNGRWTDWVKNGETAGSEGQGLSVEGVRMQILPAGKEAPKDRVIDAEKPMVALTFDDGPKVSPTNRILDVLEKNDARATFFMVGKNAVKPENADTIRRMAEMGCDLGNHTYGHTDLAKQSMVENKEAVQQVSDAVQAASGQPTTLLRPPYGSFNASVKQAMVEIGYPLIMWNIDTLDWKTKDAAQTVKQILDQVQDGDIILMHDIYEETADAVEQVVPELISRGFQLVTVTEMAEAHGVTLTGGEVYGRLRAKH